MKNINIDIPDFTVPDISSLGDGIIEVLGNLIDMVFSVISGIITAISSFYRILININSYINTLCESCKNNNMDGLPLVDIIGLYRFIVTDPVFIMTYILILTGCFFTIYKLVILLIKAYNMIKDGVSTGRNTKITFMEYIKRKIFK